MNPAAALREVNPRVDAPYTRTAFAAAHSAFCPAVGVFDSLVAEGHPKRGRVQVKVEATPEAGGEATGGGSASHLADED